MVNNKFLGIYKTDSEYDFRECLVLTYAIPQNKEFTKFDYENSLIVDLRSVSQSNADYLRDLCQSADAQSFKTFMQFASTRKYMSRDEDILSYIHRNGFIRKVPAKCVKLLFNSPERGEYATTVAEINELIKKQLGDVSESLIVEDTWNASDFSVDKDQLVEVKEEVPYIERVVREDSSKSIKNSETDSVVKSEVVHETASPLQEEVDRLKAQVELLSEKVETLLNKPKAGRPPKKSS